MQNLNGFVKLHRKFIEWEWYTDDVVKSLFLHLLILASFKPSRWQGRTIERGQVITSIPSLAEDTNHSIQEIRTALSKLEMTGEISTESTNRFRVITITNFDAYQDANCEQNMNISEFHKKSTGKSTDKKILETVENTAFAEAVDEQATDKSTDKQQASNRQATASKEYKECKECKEDNKNTSYFLHSADKSAAVQQEIFISLPLNDNSLFDVSKSQIARWRELYPAVDIEQELRNMRGWIDANPTRRKTKKGITRFVNNWLTNAQNKGGRKYDAYAKNNEPSKTEYKYGIVL